MHKEFTEIVHRELSVMLDDCGKLIENNVVNIMKILTSLR